jgi:hypothetical protein
MSCNPKGGVEGSIVLTEPSRFPTGFQGGCLRSKLVGLEVADGRHRLARQYFHARCCASLYEARMVEARIPRLHTVGFKLAPLDRARRDPRLI